MSNFIPFFTTPNLLEKGMTEARPWEFAPDEPTLEAMRRLPKPERVNRMSDKSTSWNVYSAVGGISRHCRVTKENPPARLRGLVADYDVKSTLNMVRHYLAERKNLIAPNFIETSLSGNVRLVWVFEREVLVPDSEFCGDLIAQLFDELWVDNLLAGYDANSAKPSQVWTNGGRWHAHNPVPLPWTTLFGMIVKTGKRLDSNRADIPLDIIGREVEKRYPGRWQGPFELNQLGVRFWDETADCLTGCQIKPEGMLCFTGRVPFMRWDEIFGAAWANEQRVVNLGTAAGNVHFDGRSYWDLNAGRWCNMQREDVLLALKTRGISTKAKRGQTASDAEQVLHHIQRVNRVDGAGPLINQRPGVVQLDGRRVLNISTVRALEPSTKEGATHEDFPWTWGFLNGLFDRPDLHALDHFLAWLRRAYMAAYEYRRLLGQAVFLCGPRENGKTLLCYRYIKPLLGNKCANPYDYFTGVTEFNAELFESSLLAINDEEATTREEARQKFLARIKSFVVNPSHSYNPKFCNRINIEWTGRIFATLNDDPTSVGLLPEVNGNTCDKLMFFASRPYPGEWESSEVLEPRIEKELPFFARWLLNWTPPDYVLAGGRMGVKSFFDPRILDLSKQQNYHYNLLEVIRNWCRLDRYWDADNGSPKTWEGEPLDLFASFSALSSMQFVAREWKTSKVANSMAALARNNTPGIEFVGEGTRRFRITRDLVLNPTSTGVTQAVDEVGAKS